MNFLKSLSFKDHIFWTPFLAVASHFSSSIHFPEKDKISFFMTNQISRILCVPRLLILRKTVFSAVCKHGTPTLAFLPLDLYFQRYLHFYNWEPLMCGVLPPGQTLRFLCNYSYFLCAIFPPTLDDLLHITILSSISFSSVFPVFFSFYWYYGWLNCLTIFSPT